MNRINYRCPKKFEDYLRHRVFPLKNALEKVVISQKEAINTLVMGIFGNSQRDFNVETKKRILGCGHTILCGATGSAKTTLSKAISCLLGGQNRRISGSPDITAGEIHGYDLILLDSSKVTVHGAAFNANILVADEVNRLSPKSMNSLLELLAENQVTIGEKTYKLKEPFFCVATINPSEISNRGTAKLSEALADRFVFTVLMQATNAEEKVEVAKRTHKFDSEQLTQVIDMDQVNEAREYFYDNMFISDSVRFYMANLLNTINNYKDFNLYNEENEAVEGIPLFKQLPALNDRAMLHLENAGMASAMLAGRDYVCPSDVKSVALRVLRGRLLLNPVAVSTLLDLDAKIYNESQLIDSLVGKALAKVRL